MERYLCLLNNYDDYGIWKSFLASLLIHIFMFVIMATTGVFYPETGDKPRLDIVWFYPSLTTEINAGPVISAEAPGHPVRKTQVQFVQAWREDAGEASASVDHPGKVRSGSPVNSPSPSAPITFTTKLINVPAFKQMKAEKSAAAKTSKNEKHEEQTSDRSGRAHEIIAPTVAGELKLEISAPPETLKDIRISVLFREHPKAQHNWPMSKSDAMQVQTLVLKLVKPAENLLIAVIETARDGIYDFIYTSETLNASEAAIIVKIHDNGTGAQAKAVGKRPVSAKGSIAKVLMPEGILWNDESSFSGSMEDSDSITKFNTDTGLTWKEYRE